MWLCPCSVKENLIRDIIKHTGSKCEDIITICGIETLSSSINANVKLNELMLKKEVYLVVDESNLVKNHRAKRTENIIRLSQQCKYKLILNGTPISRNEADLYAQWYILDWRILGYKSFWSFAANHLEYDERVPGKITRCLNVTYLTEKIAPYTYQVTKEGCLNLPSKSYEIEYYILTNEQDKHYEYIADELLFQVNELEPHTIYRMFTGLQNVISGFRVEVDVEEYEVVDELNPCGEHTKKVKKIKGMVKTNFFENPLDNPRIQKLLEVIEHKIGEDEKTIIFCKYTEEIRTLTDILNAKYGEGFAVAFNGEVTQKQRQENILKFSDNARYFVANKTCAGYGLNLQFCNNVIYYSNDWDYATRAQSEDRVHRIGQNKEVNIYDICAGFTLDERIIQCLKKKENLVDSFKREIDNNKDRDDLYSWVNKKDYRGKSYSKKIKALDKSDLKEEIKMKTAYFTKNINNKFEYIKKAIANFEHSSVVYFCPKKYSELAKEKLQGEKVYIFHYEDINKSNEPYNVTDKNTLLILDGSARYKNITSYVFKRIERLALVPKNKLMVDTVPFTTDIMYSYIPFSHLKRQILGHQHWYAFRENNMEYNSKGELVEGHNFELLAEKMSPVTDIDYPHFMECDTTTITCEITNKEKQEYDLYRDNLFEEYESIQPVLTRLADFVNTRKSRYENLYNLVKGLSGETIVYTNIKSHNSAIKKLLKEFKNVEVRTFYDNNEKEQFADNIILAEVPIVKNYLFLDVIANAKKEAKFYFITGTTTIDELLYKRMVDEFTQIDEFTSILSKKVNGVE